MVHLQPSPALPGEYFDRVPLRLEAAAAFAQHLTFLKALHDDVPSVAVVALQLDSRLRDTLPRPTARYEMHWFTELPAAIETAPAIGDR